MSQSPQSIPRYRTIHWEQYNAVLKARGSLTSHMDNEPRALSAALYCFQLVVR